MTLARKRGKKYPRRTARFCTSCQAASSWGCSSLLLQTQPRRNSNRRSTTSPPTLRLYSRPTTLKRTGLTPSRSNKSCSPLPLFPQPRLHPAPPLPHHPRPRLPGTRLPHLPAPTLSLLTIPLHRPLARPPVPRLLSSLLPRTQARSPHPGQRGYDPVGSKSTLHPYPAHQLPPLTHRRRHLVNAAPGGPDAGRRSVRRRLSCRHCCLLRRSPRSRHCPPSPSGASIQSLPSNHQGRGLRGTSVALSRTSCSDSEGLLCYLDSTLHSCAHPTHEYLEHARRVSE